MKIKPSIKVLALVIVGFWIALLATKKQAEDQRHHDVSVILEFSNQVVTATRQIDELGQVNLALTNDLANSRKQIVETSQGMEQLSNTLANVSATLASTKESLVSARTQIASLNTQVADLEAQNKALDQRAIEATNRLVQLNELIAVTHTELAMEQTNNAFLQAELQKQLVQKAEIKHQFNDQDELRAQVRKLKTELFIARRIEPDKRDNGANGKKGAELLCLKSGFTTNAIASMYDLNVEVDVDGSVKVLNAYAFPYPPPPPSSLWSISRDQILGGASLKVLGDYDRLLRNALANAQYSRISYSSYPNGFALVTQMERIDEDGCPFPQQKRWNTNAPPLDIFSIDDIKKALKTLFSKDNGRFRVFVFIVSNVPFNTPGKPPTVQQTTAWLNNGSQILPSYVKAQPAQNDYTLSVLIYEFTKAASDGTVTTAASTAQPKTQIQCTGIRLTAN